ncbi:hypothetical protein DXG01_000274 [Tephrocybe rancida]|nr:hypothetical protein DXG01_000274 [Tephrocybe rancida]
MSNNHSRRSHVNDPDNVKVAPKRDTPTFHWVKGELLGKGSYARVYLGLNANTGELMAVKQVELPQTPSDIANSRQQEIAEALKFERITLMGLDHPNIVQYLGYEENSNYLSIPQDLKSDNILVEPSGVCKISDFGISKQVEDISQARAYTGMKGTIYWMAPEILDNGDKKGYDVKVDIWSIGCVVLEMWTGERPWFGEEMFPVMFKVALFIASRPYMTQGSSD